MQRHILLLTASASIWLSRGLCAQSGPFGTLRPTVQASTGAASRSYSPSTYVMIANRSRTLGDQVSGSGTRYFSAVDHDLAGLTPEQALQRLTPLPVQAGDGVRKLEIVIDLRRPVTVWGRPEQPADIGTAHIAPDVKSIEVSTSIFAAGGLTVITK